MKKLLLLLFPFLLVSLDTKASHIIGGEIIATKIAPETYEVKLLLYRDCTSFTGFDDPAHFSLFNAITNEFISNFAVYSPLIENIEIDSICYDTLPDICVERATYVTTIVIPDLADGYLLVYQRCCRNADIINIVTPDDVGFTVYQKIPGTLVVADNNSPAFNNYPPIVICEGEAIYFDHSASDPDGDSLAYAFFHLFDGATPFDPMPEIASPPPYNTVVNTPGFTPDYPLFADPPLDIDANTGLITGTANGLGRFVVGIVVKEYRDGILISEHYRDFQFNVQDCSCQFVADIEERISSCGNKQITFTNSSRGTSNYLWDFGDGTTSTEFSPTHTFADFGIYYVMMIAEPGDECADPSYSTVTIEVTPFVAAISFDGTQLSASEGEFYQWYLNDVEIADATEQNLIPVLAGNYSVIITNVIGCTDRTENVYVDLTGIDDKFNDDQILIFPNPSNGDLTIEFTSQILTYELFNSTGALIHSGKNVGQKLQLHLDGTGIYILKILGSDGFYSETIMIE